jgi:nickel transport protein
MVMKGMKGKLGLFLFSVCLAFSHEPWVEREGNSYMLYYGHLNPKKGEEKFTRYNPENVLRIECFDHFGKSIPLKLERNYPIKFNAQCYAVYALYSSGYWTKTVYGLTNKPKNETKEPLESWLSYKSVKRVDGWTEAFKKPLTDDLEIVPLNNPLTLNVGDKITLVVYQKGKPVKDATVAYGDKTVGTTDEEGKINVRIKHKGMQIIKASVKEKGDGTKADYVVKTTSLVFEVR